MATKKSGHRPASTWPRAAVPKAASSEKPIALTVKVDGKTYVRLCTLGATERKTNQDLLKEAVQQYLDREGA
jgi:biopolymer transport protein ExbD